MDCARWLGDSRVSNEFRGRRPTGFRKIARAVEIRKGFGVGRADL